MEITRHFTATTFVVLDGRVLMHFHLKLQTWLPPGGHIERDELPHDAAKREVYEEAGIHVLLEEEAAATALSARLDAPIVPRPEFIILETINPYHQHIDLIYYAAWPTDATLRPGWEWFDWGRLDHPDVMVNVREGARKALEYFADLGGHGTESASDQTAGHA